MGVKTILMERKYKKIGILIGQLVQVGGVGIAAIEEVRCLIKLGYKAELLVMMERPEFPNQDFTKGIPVRYLSREYPWYLRKSFKIPGFSFFSSFHLLGPLTVPKVLRAREYDVIVAHETYNCLAAARLQKVRRIPFLAFVWDPISYILPRVYAHKVLRLMFPLLLPLGRFFDRLIIKEAKTTLVCSKLHLSSLKKTGNPLTADIKVIYPGCYPLTDLPAKRGNSIISLTKWDIGKNPLFLLELLRRLKDRRVKLVVAGNWVQKSLRDEFVEQAREWGLLGRVELPGRVNEETKKRYFSQARVLVHPIIEAFGMFGLEAAACGCPIIIPRGSGVTDLFKQGIHGFFPAEGDIDSFVEYVDLLVEDERKSWVMGKSAWEVAKRNTWEDHAQRILRVAQVL